MISAELSKISAMMAESYIFTSSIDRSCRLCQIHLCRRVIIHSNESPGHYIKLSNGEAPVQGLWEMWSIRL